ncbi:MAG: ArnT family glycosyltransferase [Gemmatimonadaceae bacterium]
MTPPIDTRSASADAVIPAARPLLDRRHDLPVVTILFCVIMAIGILARVWDFNSVPPGLSQDEASSGVDAMSLHRFGLSRNGMSFPVHFVSWGSGQNALYAYLLIPFIAIGGLTPAMVRVPMLLTGILALPLMFVVARRMVDARFGLLAMFLLAISPWHILLSRWGLESNLLPFVFLAGFASTVLSRKDNQWFVAACLFFGLSLYAYGTAYVAVPVFLLLAIPILLRTGRLSLRSLSWGIATIGIVGLPIVLFVLINSFDLSTIRLGPLTIPRLPAESRYETLGAIFGTNPLAAFWGNFRTVFSILLRQTDQLPWNIVEPYGYFYRWTFPIAVAGAALILPLRRGRRIHPDRMLLLCWLAAAIAVGLLQPVNINRMNIFFIPLLLFTAFAIWFASERWRLVIPLSTVAFLAAFAFFTREFHGDRHRERAERAFFAGLLPAIEFARSSADDGEQICVSGKVNMPYIFVLFSRQADPASYINTIDYLDPADSFRVVETMGRYSFGAANCRDEPGTVHVLLDGEMPPDEPGHTVTSFGAFDVYAD